VNEANGDYRQFLETKGAYAPACGFALPPERINPMLFPFQSALTLWALRTGRAALFEDCGLGKGQPYETPILTSLGWRPIGELHLGDMVIASNGTAARVRGVYPKPEQDTYRVYFSDGCSFVVDLDHLHICRTNNDRQRSKPWRVISTAELLDCGNLRYGAGEKSRNYDIPIVGDVEFSAGDRLPVDPYLLGVFLGDGHLSGNLSLSTADAQIVNSVNRLLPEGVSLKRKNRFDWRIVTGLTGNRRHPFRQAFYELGLLGTRSNTKFVPESYLFAGPADRLNLLRGLMDTDGYIEPGGCCQFYSVSGHLADAVIYLVRSLGGIPTRNLKRTSCAGKPGLPCHVVTFSLIRHNPFALRRKAERWNPAPRDNGRWIDRIEFEKRQETVCIAVDSPDGSYVTEHFIVTHNTPQQLEWSRHVSERLEAPVLIFAPLAVSHQTQREGVKFGIPVRIVAHQEEIGAGINVTNYAKLDRFNPSGLAGIVLDESSILKGFDGKTRKAITEFARSIPFRLACTATPAPNDYMELGNHAEFLGVMTLPEMLSRFFVHDGGDTSKWRLKGHAQSAFWKWICSWAVAVRKPTDLGFEDNGFLLPRLHMHQIMVRSTATPEGYLFPLEGQTMQERNQVRRDSIGERVSACAELVNSSDEKWIVWCNLNSESAALSKSIPTSLEVRGSDPDEFKEEAVLRFTSDEPVDLVSKPVMFGYGLNLQVAAHLAFVGLSDSYEQFYQALRRSWRFGQTREVHCHVITADTEGPVVRNIQRKEKQATAMMEGMIEHMRAQMNENVHGGGRYPARYEQKEDRGERWRAIQGDCVQETGAIQSDSIDYSIFSPPFASLYTYSESERDMGNCRDAIAFESHFRYLTPELFRITKPGRLLSFHCMNLPITKERDGIIGIRDFRGDLIRIFQQAGFIYHSEVVIWKDPVTAMQRTKALGLLHKQIKKDSAMSRQGIPDYLVTMRKPGLNPNPVCGALTFYLGESSDEDFTRFCRQQYALKKADFGQPMSFEDFKSVMIWQRYASPVWMDINQSKTLQRESAREERDERHICPLQLQVIDRALQLWTLPCDLVFSPFMGIGSEGYVALKMGRRFLGIELKASYYQQALKNLQAAERIEGQQPGLFASEQQEVAE